MFLIGLYGVETYRKNSIFWKVFTPNFNFSTAKAKILYRIVEITFFCPFYFPRPAKARPEMWKRHEKSYKMIFTFLKTWLVFLYLRLTFMMASLQYVMLYYIFCKYARSQKFKHSSKLVLQLHLNRQRWERSMDGLPTSKTENFFNAPDTKHVKEFPLRAYSKTVLQLKECRWAHAPLPLPHFCLVSISIKVVIIVFIFCYI